MKPNLFEKRLSHKLNRSTKLLLESAALAWHENAYFLQIFTGKNHKARSLLELK